MKLGRLEAHFEMESINNHKCMMPNTIKATKRNINIIKSSILSFYSEETVTLNKHIECCIAESRDLMERKIEMEFRPVNAVFDKQALVNISNVSIPEDIQLILSFGPKFVFPQKIDMNNIINIVTNTADCFDRNLPIETSNEAYKQASIQLKAYMKKYYNDKDRWLLFVQNRLRRFLKSHQELLILRSDKGKHTVVALKEDYFSKLRQLILSTDDYCLVEKIDLVGLENANNQFIDRLFTVGALKDKSRYIDRCTLMAQMYGLIKIHKKGFPVRPITSACGAPGFKLAGFFAEILSKIFCETGYHVKNSLMTSELLQDVTIDNNDIIVSFDVVSMFTNITTDLMLQLIEERRSEIENIYGIPWSLFGEVFHFLLRDCANFSFENKIYRQCDSLAMGSPLSPILARILMTKVIDFVLTRYQFVPKFIALYVDDSVWIVRKAHAKFILRILNRFHDRIKFTMEMENNDEISFLDIKLIRQGNQIVTRWYKKPFASLRILNFFSNHSMTCIIATAVSFIKMVFRLSNDVFFRENRETLEMMLKLNSFPEHLIIKLMYENYTLMRPLEFNKTKRPVSYAPIPYFPGFSGILKKRMQSLHPQFSLTSVPDRSTTGHFSYLKDKINIGDKTNIISLLECQCKKYVDIRRTDFGQRASEIISFCENTFDTSQGSCIRLRHKMNKWKYIRCKNYPVLIRKYNALIHYNKNRLQYHTVSSTNIKFKSVLNEFFLINTKIDYLCAFCYFKCPSTC